MWQRSGGAGIPGQIEGRIQPTESGRSPTTATSSSLSPHPHLTSSSDLDNCKSVYDSHSDSGFLSGSNLLSSSSVDDQPHSSYSNMPRKDVSSDQSSLRDVGSKNLTSSGCLDSGIDVSDRLSSMYLSGSHPSEESNQVSPIPEVPVQPQPYDDFGLSSEDRSGQLSPNHVAILREIFTRDDDGDTQLHIAVMRGFVEIVRNVTRLIPHQAFLDYPNNTGRTVLHLAVSAGVPSIARHLIVCGASPVARDVRGNTPLHVACSKEDHEMVTHLTRPVIHSEVANARLAYSPSHTPGLLAADLYNYQGETCVHLAAKNGEKQILQHLTSYGADINAQECRSGRTALHYAVEARDPDLVAHVVNVCRASVTAETYSRLTPYQLALANRATDIATQLLGLGAPAQMLPAAFAPDSDDSEEDEGNDQEEYSTYDELLLSQMNGLPEVDDIRLAGVPVSTQALVPPPVSTAPHTINANLY